MNPKSFFLGALLIFVYMLPYFILGENAYITIHDFLDQDVAIITNLKNNGILTSISGTVPNMDGLDRSLFQSFTPFDVKMVCCYLLPPYWAIVVYTYLLKLLAFVGMYLLVNAYFMNNQKKWVTTCLSFSIAIVPFYVLHGISSVGVPMVIYAFLNLYYSKRLLISYILIAIYAFNSWLAYGGFFVLVILFVLLCYDYYNTRQIRKHIIIGALFMCVVYILANWGTISSLFLSNSFVSQRTEWKYSNILTDDLISYIKFLAFSQYHAGSIIAFPIVLIYFYIYVKNRKKYPILKLVSTIYCLIIVGTFIGVMLKHTHIPLFVEIQFNRFNFLYPAICAIMLSSCCMVYFKERKMFNVYILTVFALFSSFYFDAEIRNNIRLLLKKNIASPTFRQFYDESLFVKIKKDLHVKGDYKTKVVSVGLFPAIAEYNGFYTIDSYRVNYPVDFKHKFRKIIEKELDKNRMLKCDYDEWGSRCYIFSSELENKNNRYFCDKTDDFAIENLDIDTYKLKKLGCQYIFSSVDIMNYKNLHLVYYNSYTSNQSYWKIRVYKVL